MYCHQMRSKTLRRWLQEFRSTDLDLDLDLHLHLDLGLGVEQVPQQV